MIKKKRKIKVPAAQFGLEETNKLINGLVTLGAQGTAAATNGQHETVGSSMASSLSSGLSMAGTGAALGSVIPGIGTAAGAVLGATAGVLTSGLSGGQDAQMTSFTDYDEGKLAGFLRPGKRRRQKQLRENYKQQAYLNRAAVTGTEDLRNDFYEEYGDMGTNTFANGGITNQLAYVDDGELIASPDGTVSKVPEKGNPTDSNLVSLPEGSKILSNTLKVPGTKKTFAQVGEEMMATKKSKFNDIYAQNAAKLNDMNNKSIHDQLFEIQEAVKAKKGIKRKYKNAVIAARTGDEIPPQYVFQLDKDYAVNDTIEYGGRNYRIVKPYAARGLQYNYIVELFTADPEYGEGITIYRPKRPKTDTTENNKIYNGGILPEITVNSPKNTANSTIYSAGTLPEITVTANRPTNSSTSSTVPATYAYSPYASYPDGVPATTQTASATPTKNTTVTRPTTRRKNANGLTPYSNYTQVGMDYYGTDAAADYMTRREWTLRNQNDSRVQQLLKDINAGKYGNIGGNTLTWNDYVRLSMDGKRGPVHNAIMALQIPEGNRRILNLNPSDWINNNISDPNAIANLADIPVSTTTNNAGSNNGNGNNDNGNDENGNKDKTPFDLTGMLSTISGLAPIVSNLLERPEYQDPNYNPYANTIARTMRNRRFNINPAVRDMERNRATANYNASQFNTNTGANLAYSLQNASNINRAIADLRAQESNVNNAYLGEYANMLNNLGQQWAAETTRVDDANMANRAQARNINRAGLSGLSQWMQNRELMRNQRNMDDAMLELYRPLLDNFTSNVVDAFNRYIRRR